MQPVYWQKHIANGLLVLMHYLVSYCSRLDFVISLFLVQTFLIVAMQVGQKTKTENDKQTNKTRIIQRSQCCNIYCLTQCKSFGTALPSLAFLRLYAFRSGKLHCDVLQ